LLLLRKNLSLATAPALLAAFALFAVFSPLGAREVSLASQSARLEKLLAETAPRSQESTRRLASAAEYISLNYDLTVIERFVGKLDIPANSKGYKIFAAVREKLALPELIGNGGLRSTFRWPDDKPVPLGNAKNLFPASGASSYANLGNDAEGKKLSVSHEGGQIVAKIGSNVDKRFDLGALDTLSTTAPAPPSFNWDIAGRAFTIVVVDARWEPRNGSTPELEFASFLVLEK